MDMYYLITNKQIKNCFLDYRINKNSAKETNYVLVYCRNLLYYYKSHIRDISVDIN